ncbi:oxaloacetate decarboxylase [Paraburkholderia sp. BCC1884]|uniref:isocitrate lyase/PEP mutase family protein n=1 Tax=Paraburkholderia sp. BCC1884 TaxID=2562668 RepID=UPI00118441BA|nr:isocitrate lyase/PEP mutase family protein [Paraburkholderia sp. BCC1884]
MTKCEILKNLIKLPKLLIMPAVFDGLSAKLVEEANFAAVQCTGLGVSATEALPDFSIVSMREMVDRTRAIAGAVEIPVMADGDTGYGGVVNVWYAVREFEKAGAAGLNIEDQTFPKRCGRIAGKEIVSVEEMQAKIKAACAARVDPNFVINARTDALGLIGMDEAVRRGNAYMDVGATMVFIQGVRNLQQAKELTSRINGPVAMNLIEERNDCEALSFLELERAGIARVSLSVSLMLASVHGMRTALRRMQEWGGTRIDPETFASFADLQQLAGMPFAESIEERFS